MEARKKVKSRIFLGYTSNMISSGVRETIRYLVQNKLVCCGWARAGRLPRGSRFSVAVPHYCAPT